MKQLHGSLSAYIYIFNPAIPKAFLTGFVISSWITSSSDVVVYYVGHPQDVILTVERKSLGARSILNDNDNIVNIVSSQQKDIFCCVKLFWRTKVIDRYLPQTVCSFESRGFCSQYASPSKGYPAVRRPALPALGSLESEICDVHFSQFLDSPWHHSLLFCCWLGSLV